MGKNKSRGKSGESDGEEELDMEIADGTSLGEVTGEAIGGKPKRRRCPQCDSTQGYLQITSGAWICRACGMGTLMSGKVVDARELLLRGR